MSNIYLDRLDRFVETELIPKYTRGKGRADNPAYKQVTDRIVRARRRYDQGEVRRLRQQLRTLPRGAPRDPGYRRLRYTRYADLCRARHKSAYAEVRVMPIRPPASLVRPV